MKINKENLKLIHSALTMFIGEPIDEIDRFDDLWLFKTINGKNGMLEQNFVGNMDIWIGEEFIYEIEKKLFDIIEADKGEDSLIDLYKYMKTFNLENLQNKSKNFFEIMLDSLENIILNYEIPLIGHIKIKHTELHYNEYHKIKIILN